VDAVLFLLAVVLYFGIFLFHVAVTMPFQRWLLIRRGIFPSKPYLLEVVDVLKEPGGHVARFARWVLTFFISLGMYQVLDWVTGFVPKLGPNYPIHWTAIWFLTLLPCTIIPPFWRRRTVITGTVLLSVMELSGPRTYHGGVILLPPTIGTASVLFGLVGVIGAYAIAYQVDKYAYQKLLALPQAAYDPKPVFDSPLPDLLSLLLRQK
jgi:hypothetical protein